MIMIYFICLFLLSKEIFTEINMQLLSTKSECPAPLAAVLILGQAH